MIRQKALAASSMLIGLVWLTTSIILMINSGTLNFHDPSSLILLLMVPMIAFPAFILFYYGLSFWKSAETIHGETIIANFIGWSFLLGAFHLVGYFPEELAERARDYALPIAGIISIIVFTLSRPSAKTFFEFKDGERLPPIGKARGTVLGFCVYLLFQNVAIAIKPTGSESPFVSLLILLSPFIFGILSYRISRSYFAKIEPS